MTFCPAGYVSLAEIYDRFEKAVRLFLADEDLERAFNFSGPEDSEPHLESGVPNDEVIAYATWLTLQFIHLRDGEIGIASPSGAVLSVAPWILDDYQSPVMTFGPEDFPDLSWDIEAWEFPKDRASRLFFGDIKFDHVDTSDWSVAQKNGDLPSLKLLVGMPLCVPSTPVPTHDIRSWVHSETQKRYAGIRAENRSEALLATLKEEVRSGSLRKKADVIKRLRHEKYVVRDQYWRDLTDEFPHLSKPGRKPTINR